MSRPTYLRLSRTPHSEQYQLVNGDDRIGHLDLHFGINDVFATLVLEMELPEEDVTALIEQIDEDLVVSSEVANDDFYVRVFTGSELTEFIRDFLRSEVPDDGHEEFDDI
ncbi:MAG: hypothetical protein NVSMB52_10500 [Chloroflexota bacterium]